MEKLSQVTKNQNMMLAAGLGLLTLGGLVYYSTSGRTSVAWDNKSIKDKYFSDENVVSYATECDERAKQLKNVRYKLIIKLCADQKDGFSGCIEIHFSYVGDKDVYVDF